jgi:hypothetical protein
MQLFALGLVKDEADVLEENIRHAASFCDRVFYMDNGSSDDSWSIIETLAAELPGKVIAYERTTEPYIEGMRNRIYNEMSDELGPDGWWLKLDADEFLASDPHAAIADARRQGANGIRAWQVQFAFTDADRRAWDAGEEDRSQSIRDRRRYYQADWREFRLWQNQPGHPWVDVTRSYPPEIDRPSRHAVFNRHYQYRDPIQIQHRLDLRRGDHHFPHEQTPDWTSVVRPASECRLHVEGQPWRVDWRRFLQNQAQVKSRKLRAKLRRAQPAASRTSA